MLFEETILEKGEYQKFSMFRILKSFEGTNYTIIDISNAMGVSYQQTYNILQELLEDIKGFPNANLQKLDRKTFLSSKQIPITIDMYRLFLLKRSIVFQFINYIVQGANPNVEKFCQDHFISRSTLLRKNAPLKVLLEKYQIKISYNELGLIGDEKRIRFFLYCFYWLSFRGLEWPFKSTSYFDVSQQLQLEPNELNDPVVTIRTVLFWSISRIRVIHGYQISDMESFNEIFPRNLTAFNLDRSFNNVNFPNISNEQLLVESQFFLFFRLQSLIFPNSNDEISNKIYQEIKADQGTIWELTEEFITETQKHLIDGERDQQLANNIPLQANLMRIFFSYYVMKGDYFQFNDFYDQDNAIDYNNSTPYKIVSNFVNEKHEESKYRPYLIAEQKVIDEIQYLMIPYLRFFKSNEAVKVKLILESSDLVTRDVMTFLDDLSFVDIENEGDDPSDADVIVSSIADIDKIYSHKDLTDKIIVDWNLDANETEYFNLYQTLKKVFTEKTAIEKADD
ncbi:helix-turn-helix domain-containing protein [Xylocopilactobacillus apicola]|uniref:Transcriptional regulator n=1 Tax=Xylocopilactobacillus apicola TaxID=2932184 RepID=A0AAU9DVR7_9LACO|nr:helix-turn-helix domain-containing protein [Xylocopilactobacillus apicola]BDR59573.1 transcriptional regulator [Xylocopilactobacillus apicola]